MRRCRLRAVCRRECAKARTEQGNVKHLEEHTPEGNVDKLAEKTDRRSGVYAMSMTSRERMLTALANGRPDRLPCQVHGWMADHPEGEQLQQPGHHQGPGGHRRRGRRAAAGLLGDRLHHLSGQRIRLRPDGGAARTDRRGQGGRARGGGVELSARPAAGQGRRDGGRHLRLCRAHGGPAGRAHHQGEAADRRDQPGGGEEDLPDQHIDRSTLAKRVAHVVQACFTGRRIVVFSGGEAKDLEALYEDVRGLRDGGANGSIIGRNTFQRPKAEALAMLGKIIDIYQGKA